MFEALIQGVQGLLHPIVLVYMLGSTMIGIVFGMIPGLGGMNFLAVLIPFTFGMPPLLAMTTLLAGHSVVHMSGAISAILVNVPGTASNATALLDGFPLAQQGHAGRAIGASVTASAVGGLFGAAVLVAAMPVMRIVVLSFGSPELFFMCFLGITFIATVAGESPAKGLLTGLLGVSLSLIGFDAMTATARLTFGIMYLDSGVPLIPLVLGLFAIPQVVNMMATGRSIVAGDIVTTPASDIFEGIKDVFRHFGLAMRTSGIGALAGAIPGLGAEAAGWMSYGHAKQTSKNPELFGRGNVEGLIGPGAAENSKEGGALVPTLAFGIPGSSGMAVMLGAFLVVGIDPGPMFLKQHLDICYAMVITLCCSNVLAACLCLSTARYMAKVTTVPSRIIAPLLLTIVLMGSYNCRGNGLDVVATFVIGALGYIMMRLGYPRPPLILGFVLGALCERYLHLSLKTSGLLFFLRPISMVIIALTIIGLFYNQILSVSRRIMR
jgi:putative tricarboxylic transport membrane protein